jgi:hypothetical protein
VAKGTSGAVAVASELVLLECIAEALDCSAACAIIFSSVSILTLQYYQLLTIVEATASSLAIVMTIRTGSAHITLYDDALTKRTISSFVGSAGVILSSPITWPRLYAKVASQFRASNKQRY